MLSQRTIEHYEIARNADLDCDPVDEIPPKRKKRTRRRKRKSAGKKLKLPLLQVTDHAVLRYWERVIGFDPNDAIQQILTPELIEQYATLGDGEYPVNGFRVLIRNRKVITVLPLD